MPSIDSLTYPIQPISSGVIDAMDDDPQIDFNDADRYGHETPSHIYDNLRRWAQRQPDPPQAALGYAAAQLLDLSMSFVVPIQTALRAAEAPLETVKELGPEIDMMLKVGRQADRFMNISAKFAAMQAIVAAKKSDSDTYAAFADPLRQPELALTPVPDERATVDRPR